MSKLLPLALPHHFKATLHQAPAAGPATLHQSLHIKYSTSSTPHQAPCMRCISRGTGAQCRLPAGPPQCAAPRLPPGWQGATSCLRRQQQRQREALRRVWDVVGRGTGGQARVLCKQAHAGLGCDQNKAPAVEARRQRRAPGWQLTREVRVFCLAVPADNGTNAKLRQNRGGGFERL